MKRAVVFSGGTICDYERLPFEFKKDDYIICADCGVRHCIKMGIKVDLWVGDFDSADFSCYSENELLKDAKCIHLNTMKDDTDTEHALDCAMERGYKEIVLIGAIGSRFDHTLANVMLLEKAFDSGASLKVIDEKNIIHFLKDSKITIFRSDFKFVSIVPLQKSTVSCTGFMYPLFREILFRNSTRGISNQLVEVEGTVEVHNGCVLVVESKD